MARKIRLPLGSVPPDDLPAAFDAFMQKIAAALEEAHGNDAEIESEELAHQNEVQDDNKTVGLKILQYRLGLRAGFARGADVVLTWHRDRPKEVSVKLRTMTRFEEWAFYAWLAIAGAYTLYITYNFGGSRYTVLWVFVCAFAVLAIPYCVLRMMISLGGRPFLDTVEAVVRKELSIQDGR